MWMMGCRDVSESFNAPKVLPAHIPRPSALTNTTSSSTSTHTNPNPNPNPNGGATSNHPSYLSRIHGSDLLLLNHHFEQNKREFSGPGLPTVVSSRWNPTPEQLQTLEELYRRGTRTPTADQIQHITAQLRRYGKIEGKNVFYWFQNHKARERQKRRRRSKSQEEQQHQHQYHQQAHNQSLENKASGSSRTNPETELQAKNWGFCTTTLGEESFSMQRAERIQFEEAQQVQHRRLVDRHATWQMMEQMMKLQKTSCPSTTTTTRPPSFSLHNENLHIFEKPQGGNEEENEESTTLELFPVRKGNDDERVAEVEEKENDLLNQSMNMNMNSTNPTPQFFEFL